jgi:hypothetical protein
MGGHFRATSVVDTYRLFAPIERRNMAIYIAGIMLYKFGLEAFNGSIIALASNRYDSEVASRSRTFQRIGLLTGLNQACQCIGSILIAPLIRRYHTKNVLTAAILTFGVLSVILLVIDASTGGRIKPAQWDATHGPNDFGYYGKWNTDSLIPLYSLTGIAHGMVELIRRTIPRDIVGGNVQKLKRMDALVHIFYETSGTGGAFCTALALIPVLGNNFSYAHQYPIQRTLFTDIHQLHRNTNLLLPRRSNLVLHQPHPLRARRLHHQRAQNLQILLPLHRTKRIPLLPISLHGDEDRLHSAQIHLAPPWLRLRPIRPQIPGEWHRTPNR